MRWRTVAAVTAGVIALSVGCTIAALSAKIKSQKEKIAVLSAQIEKKEAERKAIEKTILEYKKIAEKYETKQPAATDTLSPDSMADFNDLFSLFMSDGEN